MRIKRFRTALTAVSMLAVVAFGAAGCGGDDEGGEDGGNVTIRYSWWGNADRAALMQQVINLFQTKNPTIKVTPSFQEYEAYWQKMATETAGGNAPDVLQMDFSYLREYADRGVLYDLKKQEGENLKVDDLVPAFEGVGEVDGARYGVPTGGNTWAMFYNPEAFKKAGVAEPAAGWTWEDYHAATEKITKADGDLYGAVGYSGIIYNLEAQLRQQGGLLFTEDGKLGFTKEQLTKFWADGKKLLDDKLVVPPEKAAQIEPKSPLAGDLVASELTWDNFFVRYAGETKTPLKLGPVPTLAPGQTGQYLKPAMLLSASAKTEHAEEAAKLISFMINDPEAAKIMGSNRGIPSTNAQRQAAALTGPSATVAEYETAIAATLSKTPPAPPKGAGTIEAAFLRIAEEIAYNRMSVPDAVNTFFTEAEETLAS